MIGVFYKSLNALLWAHNHQGTRRLKIGQCSYVTDLTIKQAEGFQIVELYQQRGDCENVFDELKNQWGFTGFCAHKAVVSECAARLLKAAYKRLLEWFDQTASQLTLTNENPPWMLFDPREHPA